MARKEDESTDGAHKTLRDFGTRSVGMGKKTVEHIGGHHLTQYAERKRRNTERTAALQNKLETGKEREESERLTDIGLTQDRKMREGGKIGGVAEYLAEITFFSFFLP